MKDRNTNNDVNKVAETRFYPFINSLKLRTKLILILALPFLGFLFFTTSRTIESINTLESSIQTSKYLKIPIHFSNLVHEIQKERGYSSGFIGSGGLNFSKELYLQRKQTDAQIVQFKNSFGINTIPDLRHLRKITEEIFKLLNQLGKIRSGVDSASITFLEAHEYYTNINALFLESVRNSSTLHSDLKISTLILSYFYLLSAKEAAGQERSIISNVLVSKEFPLEQYAIWHELYIKQSMYIGAFQKHNEFILPSLNDIYFAKMFDSPMLKRISEIQSKLLKKTHLTQISITPNQWFTIMTSKIDLLQSVEDRIEAEIMTRTDKIISEARLKLFSLIGLFLFILVVSIALCNILVRTFLYPVESIASSLREIEHGNLSPQLGFPKSQEFAKVFQSFKLMATSINKSQTELKEKHIYINSILNSLNELLFVIIFDGTILTSNQKAFELLGYTEIELKNRHIGELFRKPDSMETPAAAVEKLLNVIRSRGNIKQHSASCFTKSKVAIPVSVFGNLMAGDSENKDVYILSATDVRDSELLKNLKETQQQLVQAAKLASLGELSAGIAHELNNPLFIIMGFNSRIKELLKRLGSVEQKDIGTLLDSIQKNSHRMKVIIQHLREFSRQTKHHYDLFDLNQVINNSFLLLGDQLKFQNIDLKVQLCPTRPFVTGDKIRLEQVFINLLTNCRDALEHKSGKEQKVITVRSKIVDSSVRIEFEDNGIGIPKNILPKLFDPFFTTKEVGKGTGLGLSISHGIISEHHGTIEVMSTPGQGTLIVITLAQANIDAERKSAINTA